MTISKKDILECLNKNPWESQPIEDFIKGNTLVTPTNIVYRDGRVGRYGISPLSMTPTITIDYGNGVKITFIAERLEMPL